MKLNFKTFQVYSSLLKNKFYLKNNVKFQNFSSLQFMIASPEKTENSLEFQNFSSLQFITIFSSFINL